MQFFPWTKNMRIIIIGAGICGLTLAATCQRFGINVTVYEQAQSLKNIGGGILIWPHGQYYLNCFGLLPMLESFTVDVNNCMIAGRNGDIMFTENYANFNNLIGGKILPVDRTHLQQALVYELKKDTLILGKKCIAISSDANKATVKFADGTEDTADLIVGADGIHSSVRNYITQHAELIYTNNCWWGGIVNHADVANLPTNDVYVALNRGKMCIVWPCANNRMMWYLPVKMPANELDAVGDGRTQLKNICENWSDEVQQIISAPSSTQNFHLPIYELAPQTHWVKNRVVTIGDAAHALGPILGQGASQAMEDAYVLLSCLGNHSDINQALNAYDQFRHDRYEKLSALEKDATSMMLNDAPDAMETFEKIIPNVNLAAMYQELIPLVNEQACLEISTQVNAYENVSNA